jgi:uncharacterized repeat protein (TIGR02543 family)
MSKRNIFVICFPFIVLFYLILSCENPAARAVPPNDKVKPENSYTVSYNANGGEGEMKASVFPAGVWKNLPSNTFTRERYVFAGWAVSADGEVAYANKAAVKDIAAAEGTVTLYAVWKGFSYTVEYNANGGKGKMDNTGFSYNEPQELRPNAFTMDGYVFAGWKEDKNKNGWYISRVFDTGTDPDGNSNIPLIDDDDGLPRSATQDNFYQYGLGILTFIRPQ